MPSELPDRDTVLKAVDIYMAHAWDHEPAVHVRSLLSTLRTWGGKLYACPCFVKNDANPPTRYAMRLGNRQYPHMKLVIELAPDGQTWLFKADTHDRHCCPPDGAAEHAPFCNLMEQNQRIASAVESAWAEAKLPTFKSWLREDLDRRKART
jgi:hypothetical protein